LVVSGTTFSFDVHSRGLDVSFDGEFRPGTSDLIAVENVGSSVVPSMMSRRYESSGVGHLL
jgi:hypothetical protein